MPLVPMIRLIPVLAGNRKDREELLIDRAVNPRTRGEQYEKGPAETSQPG